MTTTELQNFEVNRTANWMNTGRIERDFGVADSKGRTIGAAVNLVECDRTVEVKALWMAPQNPALPAGHVFGFRPMAMRGGKTFGAISHEQWFDTAEQRDAAVARYFVNAEKRAQKNAA